MLPSVEATKLPKQELQTLGEEHWRQLGMLQVTQAPLTTL
jgi:CMP-N-acetylneuraminic acid synthetase